MDRSMGVVKVGKHWINLDRLLWAEDGATADGKVPRLTLTFGTHDTYLYLEGKDREAMVKHLDAGAIDLTPATDDNRAFAEYRKRGGMMDRPAWEGIRQRHRSLLERFERNEEWRGDEERQVVELELQLLY
jgi:hypothetical protein